LVAVELGGKRLERTSRALDQALDWMRDRVGDDAKDIPTRERWVEIHGDQRGLTTTQGGEGKLGALAKVVIDGQGTGLDLDMVHNALRGAWNNGDEPTTITGPLTTFIDDAMVRGSGGIDRTPSQVWLLTPWGRVELIDCGQPDVVLTDRRGIGVGRIVNFTT